MNGRPLRAAALILACLPGHLLLGCSEGEIGLEHPRDEILWPVAIRVDSDARHAYVVNSNFDQLYRSGTVAVVDLLGRRVLGEKTRTLGAFGGSIAGRYDHQTGALAEIFVTERSSDTVVHFDVLRQADDPAPTLACGQAGSGAVTECDSAHVIGLGDGLDPGDEPFASVVIPALDGRRTVLATAGLADGSIHFFRLGPDEATTELAERQVGAGIQAMVFHRRTGSLLVSHRDFSALTVMRTVVSGAGPEPEEDIQVRTETPNILLLPSDPSASDFGRGMAQSPNGGKIAVAWRNPPSVLILDTDPSAPLGFRLVQQVRVGRGPSQVAFGRLGRGGALRVFVTCFLDDHIYVVDPEAGLVTDVIRAGRGPFGLALVDRPDLGRRWILTADFEDDQVSIFEADWHSPFYLQPIAHIHGGTRNPAPAAGDAP